MCSAYRVARLAFHKLVTLSRHASFLLQFKLFTVHNYEEVQRIVVQAECCSEISFPTLAQ